MGSLDLNGDTQMLQTVIRLCSSGGELDRISLADDDATGDEIHNAVLAMLDRNGNVLHAGDAITVTKEATTAPPRWLRAHW
jgi:hypothetical protein